MSKFLKGVDISTLLEVESLGAKFYLNNKETPLFDILKQHDINAVRLRIWNDPYDKNGLPYKAGTCSVENMLKLAKRADEQKMSIMLDFHYSDFWTDPKKQYLPKAWQNLSFEKVCEALYKFTKESLLKFKDENIYPTHVQVGNEITNGMCWPYGALYKNNVLIKENFKSLSILLKNGIKAVKEVFPNCKTILHLERSGDNIIYHTWLSNILKYDVDFDILGVSYYPSWHGPVDKVKENILDIQKTYKKEIMLVEFSFPWTLKNFKKSLQGENYGGLAFDQKVYDSLNLGYKINKKRQQKVIQEVLTLCKETNMSGFFYWEAAWVAVKGASWASENAKIYQFEDTPGEGNNWANQTLFDYNNNALKSFETIKNFKI